MNRLSVFRIVHHVLHITHHASRFTHYASRFTYYVLRFTHYALRITFYALHFAFCILHFTQEELMASESLRDLRDFAAELAWQAGKLALRHFQTDLTPELKADQSPVTIADRASERLMRELIEARYPSHSILGEEEGETRTGATYRWIIDPIDGTKTFVRGVPLFAALVGLERDGEMIVGAINVPALGDFLVAARGEGCTWNGRRAHVSPVSSLRDALLLCTDVESMEPYGR